MEHLLTWIATAGGALLVLAVGVAWWEHLVRTARPPAQPVVASPRAVTVDVALDTLHETPAGDQATRRAALSGALDRMAQGAGEASPRAWIDTRPTVLQPSTPQPGPRGDFSPSAHG